MPINSYELGLVAPPLVGVNGRAKRESALHQREDQQNSQSLLV
jgi:hypothetical protein